MRACFVSASGQNAFFTELLAAIRETLQKAGVLTKVAVDYFPPLTEDIVYVFVPHEYLPLTYSEAHPTGAQMGRAVVVNTEQPGTQWFEENAIAAEHASGVVDIHAMGIAELARRGIRSKLLQLGYVPGWDHWGGADSPRPVDLTFLGGYSDRRARVLAGCGRFLHDRRSEIHLVETGRPHIASDGFLVGEPKWRHLASSKVLLNLHRDDRPYFEWHRALEAIANGCVLVTEHSLGVEPLVPGEHFVSATAESLPYAIAALLDDEEHLAQIRAAAYAFIREELPFSASISTLAEVVEEVSRLPLRAPHAVSTAVEPLPKPAAVTPPDWARLLTTPTETDLMRMALKHLVLGQKQVETRLRRLEDGGADEPDRVTTFGPYEQLEPKVTVAVTLYNYAGFIGEALSSVALSEFEGMEVVVVDDASTDGSLRAAEESLERSPSLAGKLVARGTNQGLPAARNLAIEHARGEYIFVLDADNLVYPSAFDRLTEKLDDDLEASFAYGILEKFDAHGPYDLVSWLGWDADRLRYGNFIDAMAMVRASAFAAVGGYTTDRRLLGWEDLALWCSFHEAGMRGALVPEILGRYRAGRHSMLSVTNIDASEAWSVLLERFPFLRSG